jgi:hypothetical protein
MCRFLQELALRPSTLPFLDSVIGLPWFTVVLTMMREARQMFVVRRPRTAVDVWSSSFLRCVAVV